MHIGHQLYHILFTLFCGKIFDCLFQGSVYLSFQSVLSFLFCSMFISISTHVPCAWRIYVMYAQWFTDYFIILYGRCTSKRHRDLDIFQRFRFIWRYWQRIRNSGLNPSFHKVPGMSFSFLIPVSDVICPMEIWFSAIYFAIRFVTSIGISHHHSHLSGIIYHYILRF